MLNRIFLPSRSFPRALFAILLASVPSSSSIGQDQLGQSTSRLTKVVVNGVELHYIERGQGEPVVLVHGALDDYRAWDEQISPFAEHFRVIAYSRRYNFPNKSAGNPVDHNDLAALLRELQIKRAHLIGHSYGACTILILAIKHPELVQSLTSAEPPVHRRVAELPEGRAACKQFMDFWNGVGDAFRQGDTTTALRVTRSFVTKDQATYESLPTEQPELHTRCGVNGLKPAGRRCLSFSK
jgi:non-heme chloroperoxidase